MTFWKRPDFKALQQDWYQRLEEAGFADVERIVGEDSMLKQYSSIHSCQKTDELGRDTCLSYYMLVAQHIHDTEFSNDIHKHIMLLHSEGMGVKDICRTLQTIGISRTRHGIRFIIRKYEMLWGLRVYSPRKLNKK